jgi:hypothetical protein
LNSFQAGVLLVSTILMVFPQSSDAETVVLDFTAEVFAIDDVGCMCLVDVTIGSILTGRLIYETDEIDSEPNPRFGLYLYDTSPTQMTMRVGKHLFRTSDVDMDFSIVVRDSIPGQGRDVFFPFDNNPIDESLHTPSYEMWVWLADSTGTAFETDHLPTSIDLDDWNETKLVFVDGDGYFIAATVTSISTVSIPVLSPSAAIILIMCLLGLGAAVLGRHGQGRL